MSTLRRRKKIAGNDDTEINISDGRYGEHPGILIHKRQQMDERAHWASRLAERWALVAAEADGEDSAGRQKFRRLTPKELAEQSCATVDALFSEFSKRGWLLELPSFDDALKLMEEPPTASSPAEG